MNTVSIPSPFRFNPWKHGNSWKTAVVMKIFYPHLDDMDNLAINEVRVKHLNLSPIKNLYDSQRLLKAMKLLRNN